MGNSRIFHDFRPLGVGANQDPDPPPRVGRGPASGRHTEGPFSRRVAAAGVGVQGSRALGSTKESKCPLLLRMLACCCTGRRKPALAALQTPAPVPRGRMYPNFLRPRGNTGVWSGGLEGRRLSQDQRPPPARQAAGEAREVCLWGREGLAEPRRLLSLSSGLPGGPGRAGGLVTLGRREILAALLWSFSAEPGP